MRICDVNNFYTDVGGGVRVYHDRKLEYCFEREIPYALVIPSDRYSREDRGSVSLYHVPSIKLGGSGYRLIVRKKAIQHVFETFNPDIVEVGSPYILPWITSRALSGSDVPMVGFYHADYPDAYARKIAGWISGRLAGPASKVAARHVRWVYDQMTAVFGASDYVLEKLYGLGIRRLFRTPLGVDLDVFRPERASDEVRKTLGAGPETRIILFLARLTTEKGIDLLMDAYPHFRADSIQLVIGGHGPYEEHVDRFVAKYPEVKRLPFIAERLEVAALMASADVYLSMSNDETFGLAIMEAMACGTRVIAPDAGAAAELLARSDLLKPYAARDLESFVEQVQKATSAEEDVASQLRTYAEQYDWDTSFDRIIQFYSRVLSAKKNSNLDALMPSGTDRWTA